jgi:AraC-like DNA-binding protein
VVYIERAVASGIVACTWEHASTAAHEQLVVPDACVDLIWSGAQLFVAGPDTGARLSHLTAGSRFIGARLRPGAAGAVLGLPASELRDFSVDASDVLGRDVASALLEDLRAGAEPHVRLLRALEERGVCEIDPTVGAAVAALGHSRSRVDEVADAVGLSARQLQRRITDAVGYGPKTLQRVLRFRRLQELPPAPLVELALDAGYADQAHMTVEVGRLAGMTPVRFLKDRARDAA